MKFSDKKSMRYLFILTLLFLELVESSSANLNLFIYKEDLKKDLNLEFGSDIFLVNDGEPAPLLHSPNSFHDLLAPLPSTVNKMRFQWNSFVKNEHQRIQYTIKLTSSNIEIMPTPKLTIERSDFVPIYEHDKSNFNVLFPCSGLKEGVVDLGFYLNYTSTQSREERHLNVIVRRHCQKKGSNPDNVPDNNAVRAETPSYGVVIGLSVGIALTVFICVFLFCFGNYHLQKRKKELQVKFDFDYEMMVKNREKNLNGKIVKTVEPEKIENAAENSSEREEDFVHKIEKMPKPIFVPKNSIKQKSNKYSKNLKIWMDTLKLPYYSSGSIRIANHPLEKIPEEETLLNEPNGNKNESSILTNNFTIDNQLTDSGGEQCQSNHCKNLTNFESVEEVDHPLLPKIAEDESGIETDFDDEKLTGDTKCKYVNKITVSHPQNHHQHAPDTISNGFLPSNNEPIYKKKQLRRAFDKPGEDKVILSLDADTAKLEAVFQYLNHKWMKLFHDCLLTPQQLIMGKHPVGKGGVTNNVYQGKLKEIDKDDNIKFTPVVIKKLVPSPEDNNTMSKFINEALLMKKLRHKNLMELVGVLLRPNESPVLVMPFMRFADLNQFLRNARGTPRRHQTISTRQLVNFAVQISSGMEYLSSMKYVHRDLSTRNCILGEDFEVKISNLGLARDISKENYRMNKKTRLPIKWMAPESLTQFVFSEKSDVWSYGIVLWEIISLGKQPYSGLDNTQVQDFLTKGKRLERPTNCPDEFFHLMSLCWIQSPHDRPSFKDLHKEMTVYENKYQKYCIDFSAGSLAT